MNKNKTRGERAKTKCQTKGGDLPVAGQVVVVDPPADTDDEEWLNQEDLIKKGVFGGRMGMQLNAIGRILGALSMRQSDRDLPRTNFPNGLTSRSRITAAEHQGMVYLMTIILASAWARKEFADVAPNDKYALTSLLGATQIGNFIVLLENLLGFEEWMKNTRMKGIKKDELDRISDYVLVVISMAEKTARESLA